MITIKRTQISPDVLKFDLKDSTTETHDYDVEVYKIYVESPDTINGIWQETVDAHTPCDLTFKIKPVPEVLKYFVRVSYYKSKPIDYNLNTTIKKTPLVTPKPIPPHWSEPTSVFDQD